MNTPKVKFPPPIESVGQSPDYIVCKFLAGDLSTDPGLKLHLITFPCSK
jgi:hypothetical protein